MAKEIYHGMLQLKEYTSLLIEVPIDCVPLPNAREQDPARGPQVLEMVERHGGKEGSAPNEIPIPCPALRSSHTSHPSFPFSSLPFIPPSPFDPGCSTFV